MANFVINPPTVVDGHAVCDCCGKPAEQLKPFGGPGDPLRGDFTGALLVKTFRAAGDTVGASWECRDCIVLPDEEYWARLVARTEGT